MSPKRIAISLVAVAFVVLLCVQCRNDEKQVRDKRFHLPGKNFVLVTFDALRADHLGVYGYERNTSPRLDAFAEEASVFTDTFAQSATTLHSFASMFTSRYPVTDQLMGFRPEGFGLKDSELTLGEVLKENGYDTGAVVGHRFARAQFGFGQGITVFDGDYEGKTELAQETLGRALDVLDGLEEPFFFWVHIRQPHDPYESTDEVFDEFYKAAPGEPTVQRSSHEEVLEHFAKTQEVRTFVGWGKDVEMTPTMVKQYEAKYDGNIRRGDEAFGKLMDELDARNLGDRSVVVVAADHGESMGEHLVFSHNYLYYGILYTPILVRLPDRVHEIRDYPVMNLDIMPTILEMAGIESPETVRGKNLFDDRRDDYVQMAEYEHQVSIKDGRYRWFEQYLEPKGEKLFDLGADPDEKDVMENPDPALVEALRTKVRSLRNPNSGKSDQILEELRSLGYLK